jgi:hypothetical protein
MQWLFLMIVVPVFLCGNALAHGTPHPKAPGDGTAPPPVPGARAFFDAVSARGAHLFANDEAGTLAEAGRHYAFQDQILRNETADPATPADADHNRHLAEHLLIDLVRGMSGKITLDFRKGMPAHDIDAPVPVPPQHGAVLLEVITGDGSPGFMTHTLDMSASGHSGPVPIPVYPDGTTWLLLEMENVPQGRHQILMGFVDEGADQPSHWHAVTIEALQAAQFRFTALGADGQPTPVFLRLTAKATGNMWEPPNAVDIAPIMTDVTGMPMGPGKGYMHYLRGPFQGVYWIVPGPFETALPPGEWEVHVHHGVEHIPVTDTFTAAAGERVEKTYTLGRWVDMPARGWYSGDDHIHARMMHSEDADRIMAFVRAADVHVGNILEMGNSERTWYFQRGFGQEFRVQQGNHILVPGQEDPRSPLGHAIGLNLRSLARDVDKYLLNDWVADEIHRQGGLYGFTHVGEGDGLLVYRDMTLLMPRGKGDFGSILQNTLGTERYYDFLDLGFRLSASAGTDTPYGGAVGLVRVYAFLGMKTPFTADAWFDALKRGRTFVTQGPMIDFHVEDAMPGDEVRVGEDRTLRVHARVEGLPGASAPARISLVRNSTVIHEVTSDDPALGVLELETEVPAGFGGWLTVEATGHDGTRGSTSPVYVVREGFRTWNYARVPELLDARKITLDEIEELIDENKRKQAAGELSPYDNWNGFFAEQGEPLRERLELVRGLYEELRADYEREKALRSAP